MERLALNAGWWAKLVVVNAILLALVYFVMGNQASRIAYATQEGSSFQISRYFLTLVTTLAKRGGQFSSPLTLDWIQVFAVVLVLFDAAYAYGFLRSRRPSG